MKLAEKVICAILETAELPSGLSGYTKMDDNSGYFYKELDRISARQSDEDDDYYDELSSIKTKYKSRLDSVNRELKSSGFKSNAHFSTDDKGYVSISFQLSRDGEAKSATSPAKKEAPTKEPEVRKKKRKSNPSRNSTIKDKDWLANRNK